MSARPPLGELKAGDTVMIARSYNGMRGRPKSDLYRPATVVKVARVWVTLDDGSGAWHSVTRMRLDTQDQATQYSGSDESFLTLEQHAWAETRAWARGVLKDHNVRVDGLPWSDHLEVLADLLVKNLPASVDTSQSS